MILTRIEPKRRTAEEMDAETERVQQQRRVDYDRAQRGPDGSGNLPLDRETQAFDQATGSSSAKPIYDGWLG